LLKALLIFVVEFLLMKSICQQTVLGNVSFWWQWCSGRGGVLAAVFWLCCSGSGVLAAVAF
jgi:hypothetical protein